jgi:ribonuclease-3
MKKISEFQKRIGLKFKNRDLLREAFLHKSYINEDKKIKLSHNERLEFLGDAVLELIVTEYLYKNYEKETEGKMTAIRAALVNTESLAEAGKKLSLEEHLTLSKGEKKESKGKDHTLANTFEAVLGAIYLDAGYEMSFEFVRKNLLKNIKNIIKNKTYRDPKSYFQEMAQEKYKFTPEYKIISEIGKDHDKVFISELFVGNKKIAKGEGASKQKAEVEAAKNGLKKEK